MKADVFISYHTESCKQYASHLYNRLREKNINCWYASREIYEGEFAEQITQAIDECEIFVLLLNESSAMSKWCRKEVKYALDRTDGEEHFPIMVFDLVGRDRLKKNNKTKTMCLFINDLHWIDGRIEPVESRLDELADTICNILAGAGERSSQLISSVVNTNDNFVGRTRLLDDIHSVLSEKRKLFLHGIGGIGKSEAALQYIRLHRADYPDGVLFLTYSGSLRSLVMDDSARGIRIEGLKRSREESDEEYYLRKYERLCEIVTPQTMIVIDNYDVNSDPQFRDLIALGCSMIITTRNDHQKDGLPILEVEKLRDEEQMELYRYYCRGFQPDQTEEYEAAREILKMVQGHTLTIRIMSELTDFIACSLPAMMLGLLREQGLLAVLNNPVDEEDQALAYERIRKLFRLFELDERKLGIMTNMALMPLDGVDFRLFIGLCGLKDGRDVDALIRRGLLRHNYADGSISMHPLIAQVVMAEAPPTDEKCRLLIKNLSERIRLSYRDLSDEDAYRYGAIVESLYAAKKELVFSHKDLWTGIQSLLCRLGKHRKVIEILEEVKKDYLEKRDYNMAAYVLYKIQDTYAGMRDKQNSFRCCKEALETVRMGEKDELELAYLLRMFISRSIDIHSEEVGVETIRAALDEAVHIVDTTDQRYSVFGPHYQTKYDVYCVMAKFYIFIGDYQTALTSAKQACEILTEHAQSDEERKWIRAAYYSMAECYARMGEKDLARDYAKKAMECWKGMFSSNHVNTLLRKLDYARILHLIGDHEEEMKILNYARAWLEEKQMTEFPLYRAVQEKLSAASAGEGE